MKDNSLLVLPFMATVQIQTNKKLCNKSTI